MKITVITVCFNSERTIADTLRSVAEQTHPDVEHLIVDGKSTDRTLEIVRGAPWRVSAVVSEPDRGIWDAMNRGLALATGEVVGFLNSDDWFAHPGVLARVAETLEDPALDGVYADLVYVDPQDHARVSRYWQSREFRPGLFRRGWMPAHPTFYVRRRVYQQFGGFDLAFPRQADFELAMRLMEIHGIRCRYLPEVWVKMRTGGFSNRSLSGVLQGNREAYRACLKNGLNVGPWFMLVKMASRLPQFLNRARGA